MKRLLVILLVSLTSVSGVYPSASLFPPPTAFRSVAVLRTTSSAGKHEVLAAPQMSTIYSVASSRKISTVGAGSAPMMASTISQPRRLGGLKPPVIDEGETNNPENPDLPQPPVPIGDASWFLAVLAALFIVYKKRLV